MATTGATSNWQALVQLFGLAEVSPEGVVPVVRETVIGGVRVTGVFPAFPGDTAVEGVPGAEPPAAEVSGEFYAEASLEAGFCFANKTGSYARIRFSPDSVGRWTLQKKGSNSVSSVGLLSEVADEKHLLPGAPRGSMLALVRGAKYIWIGRGKTLVLAPNEEIYFFINERRGSFTDNAGQIRTSWQLDARLTEAAYGGAIAQQQGYEIFNVPAKSERGYLFTNTTGGNARFKFVPESQSTWSNGSRKVGFEGYKTKAGADEPLPGARKGCLLYELGGRYCAATPETICALRPEETVRFLMNEKPGSLGNNSGLSLSRLFSKQR